MTELFKKFLRGLIYLREHLNKDTRRRIGGYSCAILLLTACLLAAPADPAPVVPPESTPGSTAGSSSTAKPLPPEEGKVQLYTCDPELYASFVQLGQEYTRQTGIAVTVTTTQGEETCREHLQKAISDGSFPTIFCMHSAADMAHWDGRLQDLTGSSLLEQLCSQDFVLRSGARIVAIPADVAGYGLIYNASLLARAGFTRTDIKNYGDLETACQFITSKKLNFSAFSAPVFTDTGATGLANMLLDAVSGPEDLRTLWDLYRQNHGTGSGSQGLRQFQGGFSVFYVGGTWDYNKVEVIGTQNLDILPLYGPDSDAMAYRCSLAWGIDKLAEPQHIQACLDFLDWLATAPEAGTAPVDQLGLMSPFRAAANYSNPLEKKLRSYMSAGPARLSWLENSESAQLLEALGNALTQYNQDPSDESWQKVLNALRFGL